MKKTDGRCQEPASTLRGKTPVSTLKEDHKRVMDLFMQFENTSNPATQKEVAKKAIDELKIHAAIEEELFYPSVRKIVMNDDLMNEAAEEHHLVRMLIDEIDGQPLEAPVFHAKFVVLTENVRHHIKEEETRMLPKLARQESQLEEIALWMIERRQELQQQLEGKQSDPNNVNPLDTSMRLHAVPSIVRIR